MWHLRGFVFVISIRRKRSKIKGLIGARSSSRRDMDMVMEYGIYAGDTIWSLNVLCRNLSYLWHLLNAFRAHEARFVKVLCPKNKINLSSSHWYENGNIKNFDLVSNRGAGFAVEFKILVFTISKIPATPTPNLVLVEQIGIKVTEEKIRDFLSFCGEIVELELVPVLVEDEIHSQTALVLFGSAVAANTATMLSNACIEDSNIVVSYYFANQLPPVDSGVDSESAERERKVIWYFSWLCTGHWFPC